MARLSRHTFSEQIANLVRKRIRNGQLSGGQSLGESALAEECGTSRGPVREALCVLENEGLLCSTSRGGKCVRQLTPESVRDNYEVSALLEAAVAVEASGETRDKLLARLAEILRRMEDVLARGGSYDEHAALGSQFHESILAASGNSMLRSLASSSSRIISKYLLYQQWRTLYDPAELLERHRRIYAALLSGDKDEIRSTIRAHYAESAVKLANFCKGMPEA